VGLLLELGFALPGKAVLSRHLARFLIAAQQSDAFGITELQAQKESRNLDRLGAPVDAIAEKEDGGSGWDTREPEY
jgi:hypothetical protein